MRRAVVSITRAEGAVEEVQASLDGLAAHHAVPPDALCDMQIALDEALTNILTHGFDDGEPHRIEVTLAIEPTTIRAEIEDDCAAFDPLSATAPDLTASLKDRRVGGLGVHFMRRLMSEVSYSRIGPRNRLVLRRALETGGTEDGNA